MKDSLVLEKQNGVHNTMANTNKKEQIAYCKKRHKGYNLFSINIRICDDCKYRNDCSLTIGDLTQ